MCFATEFEYDSAQTVIEPNHNGDSYKVVMFVKEVNILVSVCIWKESILVPGYEVPTEVK